MLSDIYSRLLDASVSYQFDVLDHLRSDVTLNIAFSYFSGSQVTENIPYICMPY